MLNNIIIGKYYPLKSKIHLMNPISKIMCTLSFIISSFFADSLVINLFLCILVLLLILTSKIPLKYFWKVITSLKYIIIFIVITNIVFKISLLSTAIIIIRMVLIVLYTSILTLTTPTTEIIYGLEKVFSPLKVFKLPINKLALSLSIALRFIPTIIDQGNKILKAQASRGIDFYNANFKGKMLAIKSLTIPMFILAMKKADNLADSMEIRLFDINEDRTNYRMNKWSYYDTFQIFIHIVILISIICRSVIL